MVECLGVMQFLELDIHMYTRWAPTGLQLHLPGLYPHFSNIYKAIYSVITSFTRSRGPSCIAGNTKCRLRFTFVLSAPYRRAMFFHLESMNVVNVCI